MDKYSFQFCQKIVVLSADFTQVLLCKRKGENDYDGVFSFIGGKMETSDATFVDGIKREKDEEVGTDFLLKLYPSICSNVFMRKKDGNSMVLPHYLAIYQGGEIRLNPEEYSESKWVKIADLEAFEPKIYTIFPAVNLFLGLRDKFDKMDFVEI